VATLPSNAAIGANQYVEISAISCASPGNCTAVGSYYDNAGNQQGLLLTEKAGHWARGVEAILPANATSDPQVAFSSISCASAGNCTAVGTYYDPSYDVYGDGFMSGLLLTEKAGHWTAGVAAVLPANVSFPWGVRVDSVSCASAGNCTAVGSYYDYGTHGLLLTQKARQWERGVAYGATNSRLSSVSCAPDGGCSAVGYADRHQADRNGGEAGQAVLLLTKKKGKWHNESWKVKWPDGGPGEGAALTSVSCASAGNCGVIGYYNIGIDHSVAGSGALFTEVAGKWRRGVQAMPPKHANSAYWGNYVYLGGITCFSPGSCQAMGTYKGRRGRPHLTQLTEVAGKWRRGVKIPARSLAGGVISCASAGNCTTASNFLSTEIGGRWARGVRTPHFPNSVAYVTSISCTAPGNCGAVGEDAGLGVLFDSTTVPCVVPRLKGKTLREARHSIETRNCFVGRVRHDGLGTIGTAHVISQALRPGRHLAPGTKVDFKLRS
jgi:hypothetical protein